MNSTNNRIICTQFLCRRVRHVGARERERRGREPEDRDRGQHREVVQVRVRPRKIARKEKSHTRSQSGNLFCLVPLQRATIVIYAGFVLLESVPPVLSPSDFKNLKIFLKLDE